MGIIALSQQKIVNSPLYSGLLLLILLFPRGLVADTIPAEIADEWVVAVPANAPPFYFIDNKNQPQGFAIDVFEVIAERAGLRFRYQVEPDWHAVNEAVKLGSADIIPAVGISEQRRQWLKFTSPIDTIPVSIFTLNNDSSIGTVADLSKRKVAVVNGDIKVPLSEINKSVKDASLINFNKIEVAFYALMSGQVDALVHAEPVVRHIARNLHLSNEVRSISAPLIEVKHAIGVSHNASQLLTELDDAVQSMIHSETYNTLYQKWFAQVKPFWNTSNVFWTMSGLMILVIVVLTWLRQRELLTLNTSLQQQIDDATEQLSQSNAYLTDLTVTDTLTGINNRRAFENSLAELIQRSNRYYESFSMLIFDIDDFKTLNDQYGHDMGDRVLVDLVDRVTQIVRDVDTLCRWGGEEFTILMPQTDRQGAMKMAERCRSVVGDTLFDEVGMVTISLGVTCFQKGDTERRLFKRADDALYEAKSQGKNCVIWNGALG